MKGKSIFIIPAAALLLLTAVFLFLLPNSMFPLFPSRRGPMTSDDAPGGSRLSGTGAEEEVEEPAPTTAPGNAGAEDLSAAMFAELFAELRRKEALPDEAILTFSSPEAAARFLARAKDAGLNVRGRIGDMMRVGYDDLNALRDDMKAHPGDYADAGANYYVYVPEVPVKEDRALQQEVGFGDGALAFMGIRGDHSLWGKGVTIAVLDSGIATHPTFGQNRIKYIDVGQGLHGATADDGHATAVAALAAGAAPGAEGPASAASLLSIRVIGADGRSDVFTLSQGIHAAVDAGARVLNISLGAYNNSHVLEQAIDYAYNAGAVIVASAGNDQAGQLTWPAASQRVLSVGSIDALGQQATFSNSGESLQLTAPGVGLQTAWTGDQLVVFDGTSGSAPLVAGSLAALMSQTPGLTAQQAMSILTQYAADGGAPGRDPSFGFGSADLGWAFNRTNPQYIDTAVAAQYFDPDAGVIQYVVQNRSGQSVNGLQLAINAAGRASTLTVPWLNAGATWSYAVPVDQAQLNAGGQLEYRSRLSNPNGIIDANPANNARHSVVFQRQSP